MNKTINWNKEQLKIIEHNKGNMLVSASAGSGKTAVMLERVLRLVQEGTPIERIVILAFNNAIASEIRGKIYKKLIQLVESDDCKNPVFIAEQIDRLPFCSIVTNDAFCNKTTREFFQIVGVDPSVDILAEKESDLYFTTSFERAMDTLKEGEEDWIFDLSLKFGSEESLFEQIKKIHNYVATSANGEEWLKKVFEGVYTDNIQNSTAMEFLFKMVKVRLDYCKTCLENIVQVFQGKDNYQENINKYEGYAGFINKLYKVKNYEEFYTLINSFELAPKERQSKKCELDWEGLKVNYGNLKETFEWIKDMFSEPISEVESVHKKTTRDIKYLIKLYELTEENFKQEKAKNNKFNFTDFTSATIKLLNDPEIQQELSKRYDYICVDEYQDTNYAQEEIYNRLSNGNNLFMVGDSKQSIYRFRLSEPNILLNKFALYNNDNIIEEQKQIMENTEIACTKIDEPVNNNNFNAMTEISQKGTTFKLAYNYRSDSGVVDFVNDIFDEIMTTAIGGVDYKHCDRLKYGADFKTKPTSAVARVDIFKKAEDEKQENTFAQVYSVMNDNKMAEYISPSYREGLSIAKRIKSMVNSYDIYDAEIKGTRKVQLSDIALLARSSNNDVKQIIKALQDSQIPVDIAPLLKDNEIYEVEVIKEFLKLINNDMQDYALSAVLGSFWVGMDYDDLMEIRAKHPTMEYFYEAVQAEFEQEQDATQVEYDAQLNELENKINNKKTKGNIATKNDGKPSIKAYITRLYEMLAELRVKASFMSVKSLAEYLVFAYGYDKFVLSEENGEYKMSAVSTYLHSLEELSLDCSLSDYVNCLGEEKMEIKSAGGGNMVRAMTIHKSKGLEFPVVFLCNLEDSIYKSKGLNAPKMQINKDVGIAINYFDEQSMLAKSNLIFKILTEYNKIEEKAEAMRVFYVALTRAKNHIFLSGVQKNKDLSVKNPFKVDSFLDWVIVCGATNQKVASVIEFHEEEEQCVREMKRYSFSKYHGEAIKEIDKYLNFEYPHKNSVQTSIKYSVTEINELNSYEDKLQKDSLVIGEEDNFANKAQRGTNYHAILENIDYNATTLSAVDNEIERMVKEGVLTTEDVSFVDKEEILKVLQSPIIKYARQNKHFREREFMLYVKASDVIDGGTEDKVLVQGAVDLVIDGDKLVVVDFKKSKANAKTLKARYQKQLELYCMAVEGALGKKVDNAVLYVIGQDKIIKIK